MPKLLIIDPLNLSLDEASAGGERWSTRSVFFESGLTVEGMVCEYATGTGAELCSHVRTCDGVILGGSSSSAWTDHCFNDRLLDVIAICRLDGIPLLGICFGAQLLARALGAEVGPNPKGLQLGGLTVELTQAGAAHPLFAAIASSHFEAIQTHRDAILALPDSCELLASSEDTPVQAFAYGGILTGVQFHPEMNDRDLRRLWEAFRQGGVVEEIPEAQKQALEACRCERHGSIIENFARFVLKRSSVA